MTQATSFEAPVNNNAIRTPFDKPITKVANVVGRGKAKEVERFLKFAVVGTLGALIDLGTSFVLLRTVFDPRLTSHVLVAATISFIAAVMSNFFWNRYWTYPDSRSRSVQRQLAQFVLVSLTGWLGRTVWLSLAKPLFGSLVVRAVHHFTLPFDDITAALIGAMLAILIGIFVVMIWNFFINRYWTYNDVA